MQKKRVISTLPLKGGHLSNRISQNLKRALKFTSLSAELNIVCTTKWLNLNKLSTKLPGLNASYIIYQFICSCRGTYIGKTDRYLGHWLGTYAQVVGETDYLPLARTENKREKIRSRQLRDILQSSVTRLTPLKRCKWFYWTTTPDRWPFGRLYRYTSRIHQNVRKIFWPTMCACHGVSQSAFVNHFLHFVDAVCFPLCCSSS